MALRQPPFRDREAERGQLGRLLDTVRAGESAALVVRGEAGIGKTALLEHVAGEISDFQVARIAGTESEMELPFAGLHQLCVPMLEHLDALPSPQRRALQVTFGLISGDVPDRFLVGLATLSLVAEMAQKRPLLCFVDDAQWLDAASAQVLGFVARRILAESVLMLFAVREPTPERHLHGLPALTVGGLADADARALLTSVVPGRIDARLRDRIVSDTRGNPLALLEMPKDMTAAELASGLPVPRTGDLPSRMEEHFLLRIEALPQPTQQLMLLAAADPTGDVDLLWRAAHTLGIGRDDGVSAEHLVEIGRHVHFRHPLVRSAAYSGADSSDRRAAHLALAGATDPQNDPDRRAWHRALAASRPDEDVATELEQSSGRAQARGGLTAAAAFLRRSVALTDDVPVRVSRALSAAQVSLQAGEFDSASNMVTVAEEGTSEEAQRARALLLRGQIAFASGRWADASPMLVSAADRLQGLDLNLTRETVLSAWAAAVFGGDPTADSLVAVSAAAMSLPRANDPRPSDVLLDALVTLTTAGRVAAAPILRRATAAFAAADVPVDQSLRWGWLAIMPPSVLWDDQALDAVNVRQLALARGAGALALLPVNLYAVAILAAMRGDFAVAMPALVEADTVSEATGAPVAPMGAMLLAALRGREAEATVIFDAVEEGAAASGQGVAVQFARWANAILFNSLGRYEDAFASAQQASTVSPQFHVASWALPELIEASARTDNAAVGQDALMRLAEVAATAETDWAQGVEARSRALLSDGAVAEACYQDAIDRLDRTQMRPDLARAHLLYGEWLRGQNRRLDARDHLHRAHDMFTDIGMLAFAERARRELQATGETVRKRQEESRSDLTPQEEQIARLAVEGLTNPEIGSTMFISARTVEWHLHKVFAKLGITSRRELRDALPPGSAR